MAAGKPVRRTAKKSSAKKKSPAWKPASRRFGRVGTAGKAEGDAPVREYIAGLAPGQAAIARKVDAVIARAVPDVRRAVKWSAPFYGLEGRGWFCSFGAFAKHSAVVFFRGKSLSPAPPEGEGKEARRVVYRSVEDVDERQLEAWVVQASALPGWGK